MAQKFSSMPQLQANRPCLFVVRAAGGGVRQITHGESGPAGDESGSWFPDSKTILFAPSGADQVSANPAESRYVPSIWPPVKLTNCLGPKASGASLLPRWTLHRRAGNVK